MKKTWNSSKNPCFPFFHAWGDKKLSCGVRGIDCDYVRFCSKCGAHQTWPSGISKPYNFPSGVGEDFKKSYQGVTGGIVNIK